MIRRGYPTVRSGELTLTLYGLASLVFLVDLVDLLIRLYLRRQYTLRGTAATPATSVALNVGSATESEMLFQLRPYALVASLHNAVDELESFLESGVDRSKKFSRLCFLFPASIQTRKTQRGSQLQ